MDPVHPSPETSFHCLYRVYEVYNKVDELIAVKVLRTSLLNIPVVAFKALPLGSYV
jgi:hypothetical protein